MTEGTTFVPPLILHHGRMREVLALAISPIRDVAGGTVQIPLQLASRRKVGVAPLGGIDLVALPVPDKERLPQTGAGSHHHERASGNRLPLIEGMEILWEEVRDAMSHCCQVVQ